MNLIRNLQHEEGEDGQPKPMIFGHQKMAPFFWKTFPKVPGKVRKLNKGNLAMLSRFPFGYFGRLQNSPFRNNRRCYFLRNSRISLNMILLASRISLTICVHRHVFILYSLQFIYLAINLVSFLLHETPIPPTRLEVQDVSSLL